MHKLGSHIRMSPQQFGFAAGSPQLMLFFYCLTTTGEVTTEQERALPYLCEPGEGVSQCATTSDLMGTKKTHGARIFG